MPAKKGGIEQVWLFTCGACGAKRELQAQSRAFALHLVESAGAAETADKGWVCPTCRTVEKKRP